MDHVLTGDEHIMFDGMPTGYLLSDFWAWSSSDLLNNTLRGHFAEFIVSASLGLNLKRPQADWAPYDVYYPMDKRSGIRIEVKSAAYLQAWEQQRPSRIQFSIRPTRAWSSEDGYGADVLRQSDVYVFCVYTGQDRRTANPLNLDDWDFYVLSTLVLNARCRDQRTISLSALEELGPKKVNFDGIEQAVIDAYKFPEITPPPQNDQFLVVCFVQPAKSGVPASYTGAPLLFPLGALWSSFASGHISIFETAENRPRTFCQTHLYPFV